MREVPGQIERKPVGPEPGVRQAVDVWHGHHELAARSQQALGRLHLYGVGVTQDARVGYDLLHRAAEHGDLEAQRRLGYVLQFGSAGVAKDEREAMRWLENI